MRKLAARIVAHLAGDLHLPQFPGAIQCVSYLLQDETTVAYRLPLGAIGKQGPFRAVASTAPRWEKKMECVIVLSSDKLPVLAQDSEFRLPAAGIVGWFGHLLSAVAVAGARREKLAS